MDHTALWPSSKQFGCFAPSIPTIGPWEAAATGGILYLQRCQNISLWSSTMENLHISNSILSSQRRFSPTAEKAGPSRLPFCRFATGNLNRKNTSDDFWGSPNFFTIYFLSSISFGEEVVHSMHEDVCNLCFVCVLCENIMHKADQWKLCK